MQSQVLETLYRIKARLSNPRNWSKGAYARTSDFTMTMANSDAACSWCMVGAVYKECNTASIPSELIGKLLDVLSPVDNKQIATPHDKVVAFNDAGTTTHSMILAHIDAVIAKEQSNAT